jgi:GTP-binding protein YchF
MNIGIIGFPQSGKKTLFELLVGEGGVGKHGDPHKPISGVAEVVDPRFDTLVGLYAPERRVRSRLNIVLLPKIEEKTLSEGTILKEMSDVDALCHVVRMFEDDSVYHLWGTLDAGRDIDYVNNELLLHDLVFTEKRLERIRNSLKKVKDEAMLREQELLLSIQSHLEADAPLRFMEIPRAQEAVIASYPYLTRKEMIVVLNVSEGDIQRQDTFQPVIARCAAQHIGCLAVAVRTESEIAALESAEERRQFMKALGIEETALAALTRLCIESLGLISFFTVRNNEVRQWFIRKGATVAEAAGLIHTDMQRGFIRAEVIGYDDLVHYGGEDKVRAAGRLFVKGKEHVVSDGDILGIRFNV